ncbi:MAG: hypothetical protein HKN67_07540 [Saprospiraceae bacterium]|nr:hypothetical protein [Saprospiraceae bacterium]
MNSEIPYNVIDLSMDDSFVRWVRSGCPHNELQDFLDKGIDISKIHEARDLLESLADHSEKYPEKSADDLFDRINNSINESEKVITISRRRIIYLTVSAVAACLLVLFMFNTWTSTTTFTTPYAENLNVDLPDGSSLVMNSDSDLDFKKAEFKSSRVLKLDGEAFFEVEKGNPFVVETNLGKVEVLGTSFNVFSRENRFEVSCKTGKVKVSNKKENSFVILTEGQSCILKDDQIRKINKPVDDSEWIRGIHHFDNVHISDVLEEMERQFDLKINYEKLDNDLMYTGYFQEGDISSAFESVLWPMHLDYKMTGNKEYIVQSAE